MLTPTLALVALLAGQTPSLTKVEEARGYKLLSGPNATSLWRGYKQPDFPDKGWSASQGQIATTKGGGGGDIITKEQYADVDLSFEFRLGEKANSGILWRVGETDGPTYMTGPEYQLLEDVTYGVKLTDPHATGTLYDLYPPAEGKVMNGVGQWNSGRIYLHNGLVQHWLNGKKLVEATIFDQAGKPTAEWTAKIAASKFKDAKGFGVLPEGFLAIQDHGDTELTLRNIKARDPSLPLHGEKDLYNGKDLTGWEPIVPDLAAKHEDQAKVWSVKDGILICQGMPIGYIRTKEKYTNYICRVTWRFNPVTKKAGNSGVLLRMVGEDKVWPKSVEAQLQSGSAGDFWNIDKVKMTVDPARTKDRNTKHTHAAERPIGEWNEYEIIVNHGDIVLYVNGEELNRATEVEEVAGYICLQSEGAEIQFKSVKLTPLE